MPCSNLRFGAIGEAAGETGHVVALQPEHSGFVYRRSMARHNFRIAIVLTLASCVPQVDATAQNKGPSPATKLEVDGILQSKVKAEWEAFKKRDRNGYGDLLADDFVAVEDDGNGERNKLHALDEVAASNIQNYSLTFFKCLPLSADSAFVSYEITMEFPAKSVNRFKRLFISELWLKRTGQWKARHYQETRVR
jgi:hypothetical protein